MVIIACFALFFSLGWWVLMIFIIVKTLFRRRCHDGDGCRKYAGSRSE